MRGTTNEEAFRAYLDGERLFTIIDKQQMAKSRKKFEEAIKLDDNFARAHGYLAYTMTRSVANGWLGEAQLKVAESHARKAVKLDPYDYATYWDLGYCLIGQGKLKQALTQYDKAMDLYENFTDQLDRKHGLLAEVAEAYVFDGRPQDAIKMLERAKRFPDWYHWNLGWAYYSARDYDAAINELECMRCKPGDEGYVMEVQLLLAAAYAQKGNATMSKSAIGLFRSAKGRGQNIKSLEGRVKFRNKKDRDHWVDGLRKAGLPEG